MNVLGYFIFFGALAAPGTFDGKADIGGRSLRLACSGSGSPTVIVEAGMGMSSVGSAAWQQIAREVAPETRICLYDRAGLGESSAAASTPRSSDDVVADLDAALRAANLRGPYIFAAHSVGGLHALDYARLHPEELAGLVLVSSSHPDQIEAWRSAFPEPVAGEAASITQARDHLAKMDKDPSLNPEHLDIAASNAEARKLASIGSKPLIVVTHSPLWKMVPDLPDSVNAKLEEATQRLQRQLLALSSRSEQRIAKTAGHNLPNEDPELVADAILDSIRMVRTQ